jgi:hypothetical protein
MIRNSYIHIVALISVNALVWVFVFIAKSNENKRVLDKSIQQIELEIKQQKKEMQDYFHYTDSIEKIIESNIQLQQTEINKLHKKTNNELKKIAND